MGSTIRRLKTLEGRSLGPDEEPKALPLPRTVVARFDASGSATSNVIVNAETVSRLANASEILPAKNDSKAGGVLGSKDSSAKPKKTNKPTSLGLDAEAVSSRVYEAEEEPKEKKLSKEEEEIKRKEEERARKEEERKREETAAIEKEQRRLEEIAKAKEAEERKRRQAEKAQARAEFKAKKDAELKERVIHIHSLLLQSITFNFPFTINIYSQIEIYSDQFIVPIHVQEKQKRAKKKEKKRGTRVDDAGEIDAEPLQNGPPEPAPEPEFKEKPITVAKRYSKSAAVRKVVPPPLPLRNRSKRKIQAWMWWTLLGIVLVTVILVATNILFGFGRSVFQF